jgi:ribosomal protein S15P/S13E
MPKSIDAPADMLRSSDDARRQLLAADPFPPLPPPNLGLPSSGDGTDPNSSPDDELRREMARLETDFTDAPPTANGFDQTPFPADPLAGVLSAYARSPSTSAYQPASNDPATLRAENEEMHKLIEEMKLIFQQATTQEEANAAGLETERTKSTDLERQLQEKDEQLALLTSQIAELEKHIQESPAAPPPPPTEDELSRLADELEKERCSLSQDRRTLEQDRNQLREDEEALMKQMREMEVQMAKERAELARQRTELQRLHAEVRQELDQMQRGDGALRERLVQFQRRHQAVFDRGNGAAEPAPPAVPVAAAPAANGRADTGFVKRLFGR